MAQRPPLFSIALLSAGALSFEILLIRLFSIIQWHHFGFMIISLALLGYGMSGAFVSIAQHRLDQRFNLVYITSIILFALSSVGTFLIAQTIPFNAEEIFWDPNQLLYLLGIFLILTAPFFFGASAICLALHCYGDHISRIYGYDLIGAGFGSITVIALLYIFFPQTALVFIGISILLAAVVAAWELNLKHRRSLAVGILLLAICIASTLPLIELKLSPYKGLEQSLRIKGSRIIQDRSSPLGLLTILESTEIPLRHAPGLSLTNHQEPLEQLGIFTDGDNMSVITKKADHRHQLAYLDQVSSALPYHLKKPDRVLILGAGGGMDILQAHYHDIQHIDAVELNPQIPNLIRHHFTEYAGNIFNDTTTKLHIAESRGFVKNSKQQYDLIELALTDGFNGSASGLYALNESYLYTVEALKDYIQHLTPDGYLAVTRWIKMPPRDTLKLFATAIKSLKGMGITNPGNRMVLIRSWQTSTLLIKRGEFSENEFNAVQAFCDARSFDIVFSATTTRNQVNRYNILSQPFFYLAAKALAGNQAETFIHNYKFTITPATDKQPYFHHFFKWSSLPEILRLRQQGSAPLLESGYLVLVATLSAALIISSFLILFPLWVFRKESLTRSYLVNKTHVLTYFFLIGTAFLFIEIAFLQRFIIFLHHPIFSISTGLAAFLVFAGLGSHWSHKLSHILTSSGTMKLAVSGIGLLCTFYVFALDHLFVLFSDRPLLVRLAISVVLIAPLATLMGMPFPLALKHLAYRAEQLVPWAWGINGCASVISATLATMLAIHYGFTHLIFLAVLLYFISFLVFPTDK